MDDLFDTEAKKKAAIADFTDLKNHSGWKIMERILKANIEVVVERLENGFEEETKADVDRMRDKLKMYREILSTPDDMIKKLSAPEDEEPNDDPFDTVETLKAKRT